MVADAADDVEVMRGDDVPEVLRDVVVLAAAGFLPHADAGDDLRRGHVGLQAGQRVHAVGQRIEYRRVVEPLRGGQVPFGAGDRVEIGQGFGHPAEFGTEDHLHVRVGQPRRTPLHPVA